MKGRILRLLKKAAGEGSFLSGQTISDDLGVSRTAVWKCINQLRADGYDIDSSRRGYCLKDVPDRLTGEEISDGLRTVRMGRQVAYFDSIGSTNSTARRLADAGEKEGTLVVGEEQTAGRGRLGRNWTSPKYQGIWMTLILRPDITPSEAPKITQIAAAAVVSALVEKGVDASIKWPNDILVAGRKVCGILTEMNCEMDGVNYVVLGMGINVNVDAFPEELREIATSLRLAAERVFRRSELVAAILNAFEPLYDDFVDRGDLSGTIALCRRYSALIGRRVRVISGKRSVDAEVLSLSDDGRLVVRYDDGSVEAIISGEISIRPAEGIVW